jgi:hypothetical protein
MRTEDMRQRGGSMRFDFGRVWLGAQLWGVPAARHMRRRRNAERVRLHESDVR